MPTSFMSRPAVWEVSVVVMLVAACAGAVNLVSPYLKYDKLHLAAAWRLDRVTVEGFDYVGENKSDPSALSRFWIRREAVSEPGTVVRYDGRLLRVEIPDGDGLARPRLEQEIGWLSLPDKEMPCALSAYQVHELMLGIMPEISAAERTAIRGGTITLIRVAVACGGG